MTEDERERGASHADRLGRQIEKRYPENGPRQISGRLIFGIVILALGLTWTLENLGLTDASEVLRWWPALLFTYGLVRLFGLDGARRQTSGLLFLVIGGWLLAREIGWVTVSIFKLWPLFMIGIGASLVWRSMRGPAPAAGPNSSSSYPRPFAFMGANTTNVESQALQALEATAIMGGVEIDLHGARAAQPEVSLEAFAWWGGIEVCVPDDWEVISEVTPVMGGVENTSRLMPGVEPVARLIVRGMVIMGGIEIKNGTADGRKSGTRAGIIVGQSQGADEARRREQREAPSQKPVE